MYLTDARGRMVPPARVLRSRQAHFDSPALPSWITTDAAGATTTFGDPEAAPGYVQVAPNPAATQSKGLLRSSGLLPLQDPTVHAAAITVESVRFDAACEVSLEISNDAGTAGARLRIGAANGQAVTGGNPSAIPAVVETATAAGWGGRTVTALAWSATDSEASRRRNLTLLMYPRTKWVTVLMDNEEWFSAARPEMAVAASRWRLTMTTLTAAAHHVRVAQVRDDLWHN